jgi:hypothetical protein
MIKKINIKANPPLDKIEYMTCQTADSLKSEIRKLIIYHHEYGQQLENISIDQEFLRLKFSINDGNEKE